MKMRMLSIPEIALIAGTRGLAGAGLGLLLADRFTPRHCRTVGWTLFLLGAISTVPILRHLLGKVPSEMVEPAPSHEEQAVLR